MVQRTGERHSEPCFLGPSREFGPASTVRCVGPLHLDRVRRLGRFAAYADLRNAWGSGGRRIILFASECGSEMRLVGRAVPYDEFKALDSLLDAVKRGLPLCGQVFAASDTTIVIRPHPRDRVGKYDQFTIAAANGPEIRVSDAGAPEQAVLAADLVVGMDSQLLREAEALGRPAFSLLGLRQSA